MDDNKYIAIDLELLRVDTIIGIDLFLKVPQGYVLYRSQNVPFNDKIRKNLVDHGVTDIYIRGREQSKFNQYLENNLGGILADPKVKIETKRQLVYDSSLSIAKELLMQPSSISTLKRSSHVVENMVDLHLQNEGGFQKLVELMPEDYTLHSHSANVATFSIAMAKSLGIFNRDEIYELGLGAFLHDIGKSKIPAEILHKPGPLTFDEFETMKEHVGHGIDIAKNIPVIPKGALQPIHGHHERLSGDGYPNGSKKEEIHIFGMITAIADSFDAMTTDRVYQKAKSTYQVLQILIANDISYDRKIVMEMVKLLGPKGKQIIPKAEVPSVV